MVRCVMQQSTEDGIRKCLLRLRTISTKNKKWGCNVTTDLRNTDTEDERV